MKRATVWLENAGLPVRLNPLRRARRLTLRLAQDGSGAVLTHPPGVSRADLERFLHRHSDWLMAVQASQPTTVRVAPGVSLPVHGVLRRIEAADLRAPRLEGDRLLLPAHRAPGPAAAAWLKMQARAALVPMVERYAALLDRRIAGVTLRDTRSRWGSCSCRAQISFSWRLAMVPPQVQDYVAAHEAAHLVQMNHSDRYWAVLERVMPDYARHRAWLRREGRGLHRYRFESDAGLTGLPPTSA